MNNFRKKQTKQINEEQKQTIETDVDAVNLGIWLNLQKGYFTTKRAVIGGFLTVMISLSQLLILVMLLDEEWKKLGNLHRALDLLKQDKLDDFRKLPYSVQEIAEDCKEIDEGNQVIRVLKIWTVMASGFVVMFYESRSLIVKCTLFLKITQESDEIGLLMRFVWGLFLYVDVMIIFGCIAATLMMVTISPGVIDVLANAFTILILAEYGKLVANYLIARIESEDLTMTTRDDFMKIEIDPSYQVASLYWFNLIVFQILLMAPEVSYRRGNEQQFANLGPTRYINISTNLLTFWVLFFPVFLTILFKIIKHRNQPSQEVEKQPSTLIELKPKQIINTPDNANSKVLVEASSMTNQHNSVEQIERSIDDSVQRLSKTSAEIEFDRFVEEEKEEVLRLPEQRDVKRYTKDPGRNSLQKT